MDTKAWGRRFESIQKLVEQFLGFNKISGIEAFGEPAIEERASREPLCRSRARDTVARG